jgi:hypothetical protein
MFDITSNDGHYGLQCFPPFFLRKMVWNVTGTILGKRMLDEDMVCYVCSDVVPLNT